MRFPFRTCTSNPYGQPSDSDTRTGLFVYFNISYFMSARSEYLLVAAHAKQIRADLVFLPKTFGMTTKIAANKDKAAIYSQVHPKA